MCSMGVSRLPVDGWNCRHRAQLQIVRWPQNGGPRGSQPHFVTSFGGTVEKNMFSKPACVAQAAAAAIGGRPSLELERAGIFFATTV